MPRALVIGVNGQDGSYLAEHLLSTGFDVVGCGRQEQSRYVRPETQSRFDYQCVDLAKEGVLATALSSSNPDYIYYLSAIHGASGFFYEDKWQDALKVNLAGLHTCLEHMRLHAPNTRLLYASSLKAFGARPPEVVREDCLRVSSCLYSISKNAGCDLIDYYRKHHGAHAIALHLLNHESPRRPAHFFLPRTVGLLANVLNGTSACAPLQSLDFCCDWGSSDEFMQIGHRLLQDGPPQDYVLATGKTWTGAEFVDALFRQAGLDWQDHVQVKKPPGSEPVALYQADISRLKDVLGHGPRHSAIDVAMWILKERHGLTPTARMVEK